MTVLDIATAKFLIDRVREYGKAAHEAAKKGDFERADALHSKAEESLRELYAQLGIPEPDAP